MSDKHDFKSNLDAGGADSGADGAEEKSGGLFGGLNQLAHAAQDAAEEAHRPHSFADSLKGLADAAAEATKQADKTTMGGSAYGGVADAAAAAKAAADAAEKMRQAAEAAQQAAQPQFQSGGVVEEEEFVGSGGVGSEDQLDAIRRGYAERGMADPSGLGGPNDAAFQSNLDAIDSGASNTDTSGAPDMTADTGSEDDFQGSGGVDSDMLDAIRRGYAERGMADPSSGSGKAE